MSGSPNCSRFSGPNSISPLPCSCSFLSGNRFERSRAPAGGATPDLSWDEVKALVIDSVSSPHSKRAYARALEDFAEWARQAGQGTAFGNALVQRYRPFLEEKGLAPSSINVRLAALRKLTTEAADNGLLDPAVASAIGRVKGSMRKGRRIGRWLTREEASTLLRDSGEEGLKAKRDRALLCLFLGRRNAAGRDRFA